MLKLPVILTCICAAVLLKEASSHKFSLRFNSHFTVLLLKFVQEKRNRKTPRGALQTFGRALFFPHPTFHYEVTAKFTRSCQGRGRGVPDVKYK